MNSGQLDNTAPLQLTAMQKIPLTRELAGLVTRLKAGDLGVIEKIQQTRRVAELVLALGGAKPSGPDITPEPDKDQSISQDAMEWQTGEQALNNALELLKDMRRPGVSLARYQATCHKVVKSKDLITAHLGTLKKSDITLISFKQLNSFPGQGSKPDMINSLFNALLSCLSINGYSYSLFSETSEAGFLRQVDKTTQDDLDRAGTADAEAERKQQEQQKQLENPQTLEDFLALRSAASSQGKTSDEFYLSLTPEQRADYDRLIAAQERDARAATKPEQPVKQIDYSGQVTGAQIIPSKHTKKGHDIWVVQIDNRLERDDYNRANVNAKQLGGYYSSFRGNGAIPGFQFASPESAQAFVNLLGGNADEAKQVAAEQQEKKDALKDDQSQSGLERLRSMSERMTERAAETLSRSRLENTARRAGMASRAREEANRDKAIAATMGRVADQMEAGTLDPSLTKLRSLSQFEVLESYLNSARYNEYRALPEDQRAPFKETSRSILTMDTATYARYPRYTLFRSEWRALGGQMLDISGLSRDGKRIMEQLGKATDVYLQWLSRNHMKVIVTNKDGGPAIVNAPLDDVNKNLRRADLKAKLMAYQIKRGTYAIVLTPEEAKERGLWEGDDDAAITVRSSYGKELVESLKKYGVAVPRALAFAYEKQAELARMGIESEVELRAALRAYTAVRQEPEAEDSIKALERAEIGRPNDGLDFFPTPPSVVDRMLDAAELREGMRVLEPSAGMGHIADLIRERTGIEPDVMEFASNRMAILEAKGYNVIGQDFLGLQAAQPEQATNGYDRIIMNPPFSNRQDAQHVMHAFNLLKPGGRIVAIMGEGVFFGQDAKAKQFRDWLASHDGTSEKLPNNSFNNKALPVTTGASTRLVVIDKRGGTLDSALSQDGSSETIILLDSLLEPERTDYSIIQAPVSDILLQPEAYQWRDTDQKDGTMKHRAIDPDETWDNPPPVILHQRYEQDSGRIAVYLADGHHRLAKAKRLGIEAIDAIVLDESEGYSIAAVKAICGILNLSQDADTDHKDDVLLAPAVLAGTAQGLYEATTEGLSGEMLDSTGNGLPVIELNQSHTDPLPSNLGDTHALATVLLETLRKMGPVINQPTGQHIEFYRNGIQSSLKSRNPDVRRMYLALPDMLRVARHVGTEPNRKRDVKPRIVSYEHFKVMVKDGVRVFEVLIKVDVSEPDEYTGTRRSNGYYFHGIESVREVS